MLQAKVLSANPGRLIRLAVLTGLACSTAPVAADNVYHRYDSLNRLTQVCKALSGDGEWTDYTLDAADNRSNYANVRTDVAIYAYSSIGSGDGRFSLRMQGDGNLILYRNSDNYPLWASNTAGSGANVAYFQNDGNLVIYTPSSSSPWASNTYFYPCARLYVQNDGNAVIKTVDGQVVWQTGTGGQ